MTSAYSINLNFNNTIPVKTDFTFKQGDKGITLNLATTGLDPTGTTAHIVFKRSNGTSVEAELTGQTGPNYSYTILGNEFEIPGVVVADLKLYDGDTQRVSTASFIFLVTGDTMDGVGGGTGGYSDQLEQLSQEFEDTLQEYKDAFGDVGVINPKGAYDSSEEYEPFDLVSYQGSSWVCREGCQGETPSTSSTYWQLFAEHGEPGPAGQDGADGRGIKSMAKDASNHLIITYDDDQTEDAGLLPAGPAGQDGQDGADGADGRGILSMTINGSGHLIITYDDSTTEDAGVIPGGGGGLYPHVIIISDTGSTVTLVKGATTVNASETSTGHFEADVPDYGTWTIHSVLLGDDATVNLNVDDVKVYTVDDSHFAASITVTYPNGATCALSATGLSPIYATGSPYTFTVHSATTYTITVTIDGISKTDSVTITTAGQTEAVTIEYGTINLTYDAEFQGETITCINGGTTISKTAPSAGTTMTFRPPTTGTWTISGEVGGVTFSTSATVASLSTAVSATLAAIPNGSTVTPTDDVETLLHCANIWDKNYSTIAEVIADSQTLLAVISSNNAVDYMVRSTSFRSLICADALAMLYIGEDSYCSTALLADSTWNTAINGSPFSDLVLNPPQASSHTLKTFATANDAEILEMVCRADRGEIALYDDAGWRVGQEHSVSLSAISPSGTYDGVSWSVGESQSAQTITLILTEQGGKELVTSVLDNQGQTRTECSFQVDLKVALGTKGYMNATATNTGVWDGCARRNWCNGGFRGALPPVLQAAFKQFKVITASSYNSSSNITSNDYFALRARQEVYGDGSGNPTEAAALSQVTYYQTTANRSKGSVSTERWFLRSASYTQSTIFIACRNDGAVQSPNANDNELLAPFGCL